MADYVTDLLSLPMASSPGHVDQFLRTLGYAYHGACDVAEVFALGHRMDPDDSGGIYDAWRTAAKRYLALGEEKLAAGHRVSARRAFLRAELSVPQRGPGLIAGEPQKVRDEASGMGEAPPPSIPPPPPPQPHTISLWAGDVYQ